MLLSYNMATILENKRAYFDYEILDTFESGIQLVGHEVKSIKAGRSNITGSYVKIFDNEAYIVGMKIDEYQKNIAISENEKNRTRKLLLNKSELKKLTKYTHEKGLTIVPLSLYIKNRASGSNSGFIKLSIGVGRGKKKADKRETIKNRDADRALRREYSAR